MAGDDRVSPMVSVLMTSYNREKYLGEAIESVLASDYRDFELIVVDDGSKDRTVAIARQYAGADARVKVFLNPVNLGDYPNRNQAARHATGKYLKYVDADDRIYSWGLRLLVQMMENCPAAGWGLCSLEQDVHRPFPFILSPAEAYAYHYQGPGLFHKAPLSSIIRRDVFEAEGGFASIRMAGDFEMWHRLARKYPVLLMPHGIVWYREHGEQEMNSHRKFLRTYMEITLNNLFSDTCPLSRDQVRQVIRTTRLSLHKELYKGLLTLDRVRISANLTRLYQLRHASKDQLFS